MTIEHRLLYQCGTCSFGGRPRVATGKDIVHHIKRTHGVDVNASSSSGVFFCNDCSSRSGYGGKRFDTFEDLMGTSRMPCQHGLCMISRSSKVFVTFKILLSSNEISYSRIIHSSLVIAYSLRFHTIPLPFHFLSFLIVLSTLFCSINRFVLSVICDL